MRYFAITRESSLRFKNTMEKYGWTVIFLKSIIISPKPYVELERIVSQIIQNRYEACVFLSVNAVDILMANAYYSGNSFALLSKLRSIRIVCIGPRTKQKLFHYGIKSVIMPETYDTNGLIECLASYKDQVRSVAIPRSQLGDRKIMLSLSKLGMSADQYQLYDTSTNSRVDDEWRQFFRILKEKKIGAVGFTSPSSVKALFEIVEKEVSHDDVNYLKRLDCLVSIGHKTTLELKKHSSSQIIEAGEHTLDGMAETSRLI